MGFECTHCLCDMLNLKSFIPLINALNFKPNMLRTQTEPREWQMTKFCGDLCSWHSDVCHLVHTTQ